MQYFESEACWSVGARTPRVVDARTGAPSRARRRARRRAGRRHSPRASRRVQAGNGVAPALGDVLELAVAVELVAEEVAEAHDARARAPHHLGQHELVDLEQSELRVVLGQEGRGDAGGEVRPRVVPGEPACGRGSSSPSRSSSSSRSSPRRPRRPAGAALRARRGRRGRASTRASRERGAAAAARGAREPPDEPGGRGLERESCTHRARG